MTVRTIEVIKVGGSLLRSPLAYGEIASRLAEEFRRGPTRVVVSAAYGITDALDRLARSASPRDASALLERQADASGVPLTPSGAGEFWRGFREAKAGSRGRLLSWGERESAAALQVHLERLGAWAPIEELRVPDALPTRTAIVPGFYVRDRWGRMRCLPRGGSDISAVLVASQLRAASVRFWKDGGGIRANGGVLAEVDSSVLLKRLAGTVRPLHPAALLLASRRGIDLILEDPFGHHGSTRIRCRESARATPLAFLRGWESEVPLGTQPQALSPTWRF